MNIVEQAISSLKAAIKGDLSRPEILARMDDRAEARRPGIPLGEMRTRLLLDAICHAVLMGRKLKANNVVCIYLQSSLHLFINSYCFYKRTNDYQQNCIGCSLMLLTV